MPEITVTIRCNEEFGKLLGRDVYCTSSRDHEGDHHATVRIVSDIDWHDGAHSVSESFEVA